jgi:hypothetical protein
MLDKPITKKQICERHQNIRGRDFTERKGFFNCLAISIYETKNEAPEGCFGRADPLILSWYKDMGCL